MNLSNLHFLQPAWLALLAALPLIVWRWRHSRRGAGNWRGVVDSQLLPYLLEPGSAVSSRYGLWLALLLWLLATLALAGPAWQQDRVALYRPAAARVLALQLNASMLANDVKPDRLTRARHKIDDILERSADLQTALIAYAGDAFVVAPLTDDHATVANLVGALEPGIMPVSGNEAAAAIEQALTLIRQAGLTQGELILVADSVNDAAIAAAGVAAQRGLRISVLGVGTRTGAPVNLPEGGFLEDGAGNIAVARRDDASLRAAARAGGGRYVDLSTDDSDLRTLLSDMGRAGGVAATDSVNVSLRWIDRGPWLLLLLLPLALMAARRGWVLIIILGIAMPPPAHAAGLRDLWQRPDQQAATALQRADAEAALAAGAAPSWQAAARYRLQDYTAAERLWQQQDTAVSNYNRGNALAQLGQWRDALSAWERALQQDPQMTDARANHDMLSAWLAQQPAENEPPDEGQEPGEPDSEEHEDAEDDTAGDDIGGDVGPNDGTQQGSTRPSGEAEASPGLPGTEPEATTELAETDADELQSFAQDAPSANQMEDERQAMADELDAALQDGAAQQGGDETESHMRADMADDERRQAHEQWLQRIPDDAGGLLRRKFQLEHERRQRSRGVHK